MIEYTTFTFIIAYFFKYKKQVQRVELPPLLISRNYSGGKPKGCNVLDEIAQGTGCFKARTCKFGLIRQIKLTKQHFTTVGSG